MILFSPDTENMTIGIKLKGLWAFLERKKYSLVDPIYKGKKPVNIYLRTNGTSYSIFWPKTKQKKNKKDYKEIRRKMR